MQRVLHARGKNSFNEILDALVECGENEGDNRLGTARDVLRAASLVSLTCEDMSKGSAPCKALKMSKKLLDTIPDGTELENLGAKVVERVQQTMVSCLKLLHSRPRFSSDDASRMDELLHVRLNILF
jgi:hypothetical protein